MNTAKTSGRRGRSVQYSVGFAVTETIREAITRVPKRAWTPAMDADGDVREHADIVEITGLLPKEMTEKWPTGMRVIVRREHPHPGAQLSLFEHADGWRYQAFATNTTTGQLAFLEARHRAHARVEDSIRHAKDTGLGRFPSPASGRYPHREYGINTTWLLAVAIAADLTAWLRLLALPETLKTCEPKALRYRFLHIPARLTTSGRRRHPPPAGNLALDPGRRRRIHRCDGHPAPDLTTHSALTTATQGPSKTRTAAPRGTPSQPTHNKQHQREHQGINRNPVKDRG